jgi:uncharacterized membrane protein
MTYHLIQYLFLFVLGSMLGWCLEVVYRRYFGKARKWINPGFLAGPFLPLYGFGISILYMISKQPMDMIYKVILFLLSTTIIEYITGLFFLKYYKTRLWDYTSLKFNVQGIIAPMYSFFWTLLSLLFYYLMYPPLSHRIYLLYEHLEYSLMIGIILGFVLEDLSNAMNLANRLKTFMDNIDESKPVIHYEALKLEIKDRFEEITDKIEDLEGEFIIKSQLRKLLRKRSRPTFLSPFKGNYDLSQRLQEHLKAMKEKNK